MANKIPKFPNLGVSLLIFILTFLVYSPLLFNQFVGDDITFFEGNSFYHSLKNIPRLVEKSYISDPKQFNYNNDSQKDIDFGSGSFSYRPITNLTYFGDYFLFRGNPLGSHCVNVLIHCINSMLVFGIVDLLFSSQWLGLAVSLLFSFHPIQSEAVANISCRFDLLAAMFGLISFYFWIRFSQEEYRSKKYYIISLITYFFAIFSKESAVLLPVVLFIYDRLFLHHHSKLFKVWRTYLGFIVVFIYYLYLYVFVFGNSSLKIHWIGGSLFSHCLISGYIWFTYLVNIFLPWTVKIIPGLYCPTVLQAFSITTIAIYLSLIFWVIVLIVLWRNSRISFFLLSSYLIFYLPVSNVIPIANPMACRFMYFPVVFLFTFLMYLFWKAFKDNFFTKQFQYFLIFIFGLFLLIGVIKTMSLNKDWKNDFTLQNAWVRDYPFYGRGYALLGIGYFNQGMFEKAKGYLEKGVFLGDQMPKDNFALAMCYIRLGRIKEAQTLLQNIIIQYSDYADPYLCLGWIYYEQHNDVQAKPMLEKSLSLDPKKFFGYILLIKTDERLHLSNSVNNIFQQAQRNLGDSKAIELNRITEKIKTN